jgi:hypothetical protein
MSNPQPREGDSCVCGEGYLIEKDGWHVCCACGGAVTHSGKYLPPRSGWAIPALTLEEINEAIACLDREWTERQFMRDALGD